MRSVFLLVFVAITCASPCVAQNSPDNPPTAVPSTLDLPSFQRELDRILQTLDKPAEIPVLRRSLPASWTVKDGDQAYSVSTKEITEVLQRMEHNPGKNDAADLRVRLKAMRVQAAQVSLPSASANLSDVQEKLKKVLDRGEFREASGPTTWDLIKARINRWIFIHLIRLLGALHISARTGNVLAWGVIFIAVVLLFYVAYRWLTRSGEALELHAEVEPTAAETRAWLQLALAAADRHDYREAVHCAYWASIAHLEEIRILTRDRARTPRESLRLLAHRPTEQGILKTITHSFELVWYGYRPVSAAEWAGTKKELEKIGCLQASIAPTASS